MSVYVDNQRNHYGRMVMCHMVADTPQELHEMAHSIGLSPLYVQRGRYLHYDLSISKRDAAVAMGAIEVDTRDIVRIMRSVGTAHNVRQWD